MFPPGPSGILPDEQLSSTCGICGEPAGGLPFGLDAVLPMPEGLPLGKSHQCKTCHRSICAKHFSASRKQCVKCETGRDSWCKTPDMPAK